MDLFATQQGLPDTAIVLKSRAREDNGRGTHRLRDQLIKALRKKKIQALDSPNRNPIPMANHTLGLRVGLDYLFAIACF